MAKERFHPIGIDTRRLVATQLRALLLESLRVPVQIRKVHTPSPQIVIFYGKKGTINLARESDGAEKM